MVTDELEQNDNCDELMVNYWWVMNSKVMMNYWTAEELTVNWGAMMNCMVIYDGDLWRNNELMADVDHYDLLGMN